MIKEFKKKNIHELIICVITFQFSECDNILKHAQQNLIDKLLLVSIVTMRKRCNASLSGNNYLNFLQIITLILLKRVSIVSHCHYPSHIQKLR